MNKRKICVIITTRGNYAKLKSVIQHVSEHPKLELQLIVAGGAILPKYGFMFGRLNELEIKIDRIIHFIVEGENPVAMAKSASLAMNDFATAFDSLRPDVVMVVADRYECLSIAMAATYMNISLVHIEGGEVSGSIDESVRHAITKLSHFHFPATKKAAERIERLGEDPRNIFPVGCTSIDIISRLDLDNVQQVMDLQKKGGVGVLVDLTKPYLVVIQHPVTTEYELNFRHINETIKAVETMGMGTVWIWPNMDAGSDGISKGIRMFRERTNLSNIHFFKSLPIEYFATVLNNASCIVGNSSTGIREAAFLGIPSVNIGTRQNGRERSENVIDVANDNIEIRKAIEKQLSVGRYSRSYLYGKGDSGGKIAEILSAIDLYNQKKITY